MGKMWTALCAALSIGGGGVMVIGTPTHGKELKETEGAMIIASERGGSSGGE